MPTNGQPPPPTRESFRLSDWVVEPALNRLSRPAAVVQIEPKHMDVLVLLAGRPGEVFSKEEILETVWAQQFVAESVLTRAIAELRRALGDDAHAPRFIETIPKRGYRLIAEIASLRAMVRPRRVPLWLAPVLVVIVAGILGWLLARPEGARSRAAGNRPLRMQQLTIGPEFEVYPAFSPDGSRIAYSSNRSGSFEIYVQQLAPGGRDIQVTDDGMNNLQATWSPDGTTIVYHSQDRGGIWMVPVLGGEVRQLTDFGSEPAWSPDGTQLVFQSEERGEISLESAAGPLPSTLWILDLTQEAAPRQITLEGRPSYGHGSPVFSPAGDRILFTNRQDLWSIALDGSNLERLETSGQALDPVYADGGRSIYYSCFLNSDNWLCRHRLDAGGDPEESEVLMRLPGRHFDVSPGSDRMVVTRFESTSNLWSLRVDPVTGQPVGEPEALTRATNMRNTVPEFSPDGEKIAYQYFSVGRPGAIWIVGADGDGPRELIFDERHHSYRPRWSQAAEAVYFLRQRRFHRFDLETGRTESVGALPSSWYRLELGPDDLRVAFQLDENEVSNVWIGDRNGEHARQITFDENWAGFPSWSPDGRWIAYESWRDGNTHLMVVPSTGGEARQLTFEPQHSWPFGWSPDSDRVAFAGRRHGVWNLYWVSLSDGRELQLTSYTSGLGAFVRFPAWSPAGDQIVFEHFEASTDIWLLQLAG